jgi:glycosyltransferase XagB
MQTFLVHTRHPLRFLRQQGPLAALGFVFFIGGTMLSGLLNPLFWGIFIVWLITQTTGHRLSAAAFVPGAVQPADGQRAVHLPCDDRALSPGLAGADPYGLTVFWYWVLTSVAAFKGLWQLIFNPFYWEKTQHGISTHTAAELAKAKAAAGSGP